VDDIPPTTLNPNSRAHHMRIAKDKAALAELFAEGVAVAYGMFTESERAGLGFPWTKVAVQVHWRHWFHLKPDADNALASLKAGFDQLTASGVLTDDREVMHLPLTFERVKKGEQCLVVTVSIASDGECPMCGTLYGGRDQ
jgi:hypothetical protein